MPVGQPASHGAAKVWFCQTGTNRRSAPVVITGMGLRSIRLRSPIRPPWPSSASQTSRWKAATGRTERPAFSLGRRATSSCQAVRSASVRCISGRPIFLRKSFSPACSHSQSASPIGARRASAWLNPACGPRKKSLPPTMPTSGR